MIDEQTELLIWTMIASGFVVALVMAAWCVRLARRKSSDAPPF